MTRIDCKTMIVAGALLAAACKAPPMSAAHAAVGGGDYELLSGGIERSYRVHVPASYDGSKPVPLVISLHGGWGNGANQEEISGFSQLAERHGFIVAYPDGVSRAWNAGSCCGPPQERGIDDVGFVRDLIAQLRKQYRIDEHRIYGNGFSNGGMLIHRIVCEAPGVFAAVAANASAPMTQRCEPAKGVPFLIIQGRDDERMPWGGGVVNGTQRMAVSDQVQRLARINRCSGGEERVIQQAGPAVCRSVAGCGDNEVSYCGVEGVGHQWIGGKTVFPRLLGKNTTAFSASETMWAFYARHPEK
ncbi:MAG: PHB depolymerase family esterase [Sinimarinibacterium sp.]